jgi:hypothetical protein
MDVMVFEGSEVRVSDFFACHILELSNWSLDEPFQRRYPELREACKFTVFQGPEVNGNFWMNIEHLDIWGRKLMG